MRVLVEQGLYIFQRTKKCMSTKFTVWLSDKYSFQQICSTNFFCQSLRVNDVTYFSFPQLAYFRPILLTYSFNQYVWLASGW